MQFMEFLSLLQKLGLSYAISGISFSSPKTWTIICIFWNFFPLFKILDYHMQFRDFFLFSKNVDYHQQYLEFISLLQKGGLLYALSKYSFSSSKSWTTTYNFCNFIPFSKNI